MSYDIKYRQRAIEYWQEGHSKRATATVFKVSPTTLQTWKSMLKETGTMVPKAPQRTWKKIDPSKLLEYVKEHPDAYLDEMAEEFGCSDTAIIKALKRLNISRKKNHQIPGSE
jgi:transposase